MTPLSRRERALLFLATAVVALSIIAPTVYAQLLPSGGSSVVLTAGSAIAGRFGIDQTTPGTTNGVQVNAALPAGSNVIGHVINDSGSTTVVTGSVTLAALPTGTNNIGLVRAVPASCTQATNFTNTTVGVATGAGTSISSTTTCATLVYANNITNSAVTLRVQDKTGTPIIWLGGNADYSIPANSAVRVPLDGVTFTSGITAIAGTAAALNLQFNGLQ